MGGVIKIITFRVEWKGISKRTLNEEDEKSGNTIRMAGLRFGKSRKRTNHSRSMPLSSIRY